MTLSILLSLLPAAFASLIAPSIPAPAIEPRTFTIDAAHSNVGFKAKHLGILNVNGRFADYDATIKVDPSNLSTLETTATVRIASVDTGVERRDNHLKSADFFDAENHPTMTFVSTGVSNVVGNTFDLNGNLTIRGTTKPVVLKGEMVGTAVFMGKERIALQATGKINRFDYGLQWNTLTEAGGLVVSQDIEILLEIQAVAN
jgi:polyisoprenoid-binding protein YceI